MGWGWERSCAVPPSDTELESNANLGMLDTGEFSGSSLEFLALALLPWKGGFSFSPREPRTRPVQGRRGVRGRAQYFGL